MFPSRKQKKILKDKWTYELIGPGTPYRPRSGRSHKQVLKGDLIESKGSFTEFSYGNGLVQKVLLIRVT